MTNDVLDQLIITASKVSMLTITNHPSLDPIRVVTENYVSGQGRMIIQCWDRSWCSYWGSMSGKTVEEFVIGEHVDYLVTCLMGGRQGLTRAIFIREEKYLSRIVEAVKAALSKEVNGVNEK